MTPHPFFKAIIDLYRETERPSFHQVDVATAREMLRWTTAAAPVPPDLPDLASVEDRDFPGPHGSVRVRIYNPSDPAAGTIVYFHSGGWVIGDLASADATCRRLAHGARSRLISVDYRLAPEHPFPQPLDDAFAAVLWAAEEWPEPVLVGGESAGGNLAAASAIRARGQERPRLAGQWLAYPVTDHDFETRSYRDIGPKNWLLPTADMQWFWDHYCPPETDRTNPEVSPLRVGDARGLPPTMIVLGELDPLRDEGLAFAARLAQEGVSVTCRCDAEMVHGYLGAAGVVPAAAEALQASANWIRARLHSGDQSKERS
jgi:acetyl esterase